MESAHSEERAVGEEILQGCLTVSLSARLHLCPSSSLTVSLSDGSSQRDYWAVKGLLCCGVNMIMKCTGERITLS